MNRRLRRKRRIPELVAQLLRLRVEPTRIDRRFKAPRVKRQRKIVPYPRNVVLLDRFLNHRIGPRAIRTLSLIHI